MKASGTTTVSGSSYRCAVLTLGALIALQVGSVGLARAVEDPVAAAEADWEAQMRQLAEEGDEEAALEVARILLDKGDSRSATEWLRRAETMGAAVPSDLRRAEREGARPEASGGGWGAGRVERSTVVSTTEPGGIGDPCNRPGLDLDTALRRADLALADRDLERWVAVIVPLVRGGCLDPALEEQIGKALSVEEGRDAARDREVAAAVRKGRPTAGTQIGRSLEPSSSSGGVWGQIANGLIAVMESRQSGAPEPYSRVPEGADQATRNAYAGIWADTQNQIERDPEGNQWDRASALVKGKLEQRGDPGPLPPPESAEGAEPVSPGTSAPVPAGGLLPGSGAGGDRNCGPADEDQCSARGKRPGLTCVCCQGSFGLPEDCHWSGGPAPRPSLTIEACTNLFESDSPTCDTRMSAMQSGGWWVWSAEETWTVEKQQPGIEEPVAWPFKRRLWGLEKPRGCTPEDTGRIGESRAFVRMGDAGPFTRKEALDYVRSQQQACCAAASGQSRKAANCE